MLVHLATSLPGGLRIVLGVLWGRGVCKIAGVGCVCALSVLTWPRVIARVVMSWVWECDGGSKCA